MWAETRGKKNKKIKLTEFIRHGEGKNESLPKSETAAVHPTWQKIEQAK